MESLAHFKFYASLNDFPSLREKSSWIAYHFRGKPAVKDAVEALGVPHPEIGAILLNGSAVDFKNSLLHGQKLEIYPTEMLPTLPADYQLRPPYSGSEKFVLDVHLGKLNRHLRMLGFDCSYSDRLQDGEIAAIAERESRIVLTRDVGLLKHKRIHWGYWLRSQNADEQLKEVIMHFNLLDKFNPFTRCMVCNGPIEQVAKENVMDKLPPKTRAHFHEFFQCQKCQRVYWKGSHYDRMKEAIARGAG